MPNSLTPGNHSHRYEKRFDRLVNDRSMRCSHSSRWLPILLAICAFTSFAAFALPIRASAQDVRSYTEGPVTEEDYIEVQYGHFDEYIDWLNTTWKPTLEAIKKAGLVLDYKVFRATPKSAGQPNFILSITFKNGAAAFDNDTEIEDVTKQVIGSTEFQNKARAFRNEYRTVLGTEYVRELLLK